MFKFFKENKKMLLCFLTIVSLFPTIILTPSPIGIISYETGLTLIGYGGSIIGGFLTLYGVWWTIDDNSKKISDSQKINFYPNLYFNKEIKVEQISYDFFDTHYNKVSFQRFKANLIVSNIGIGKALDISIDQTKMTEKNFNEFVQLENYYILKIDSNESYTLKIIFDLHWDNFLTTEKYLKLIITCTDIVSSTHIYRVTLKITVLENEYSQLKKNRYLFIVSISEIEKEIISQ